MLDALEADRTRVAEIDTQILCFERCIAALRIQKALAQERLDLYRYPVSTLPNEIVSEIFTHFLPPYPTFPPLTGIFSPTILTHICRKWREIAIATPMLWRAVEMISDRRGMPTERQAHISDVWLGRSRCSPISIRISEFDDTDPHFSEILETVVPHRARLELLELHSLMPSHLSAIEGPMPLLEDLQLTLDDFDPRVKITFPEVPMLRMAYLNDHAALTLTLPWAQLTRLTLWCVNPSECLPILRQTSILVSCVLDVAAGEGDDGPWPDIRLPYLKSLVLWDTMEILPVGFLEIFVVPALCSLEIGERYLEPNPIDCLTTFISKCGCKLKQVLITNDQLVSETTYREALASVPEVSFGGRYRAKIAAKE
ncbi:F-box domain-containing protein [Mycena venus]|uniref:F-box domain-containing protein n=1 Tax=Mycena venus TaxID=2733690 RepID=A0A8H6X5H8_9AGAR|nr:F-box domain-containing protein [Mycena venus]